MLSKVIRKIIARSSQAKNIKYDGFKHIQTIHSKDLNIEFHNYEHQSTGAKIYHLQNDDNENAFASIVKTFAKNDKGCPHILQHLACCGSQKYPVRDPFFNMIKRSVNTYMNAWTGQDFTCYPFSSSNLKDWQNLYSVYLDMSLKPLLNELDFRQEGWRYQINQGKKQIKGIVFNEMKGSYQNSDRELMKVINESLFRGTPYAYDTGGLPSQIVNLEYKQLLQMHNYYYHPSNMSFYFYGNNSIAQSLDYLQNNYLKHYRNQSQRYKFTNIIPLPVQNRYVTIKSMNAETNCISLNYYLGNLDTLPAVDLSALRIISYILFEKSNALVYRKFIQSGIGQNLGFSGLNESKVTTFVVTLKGIYSEYSCKQFQKQYEQILFGLIQNGIQKSKIEEYVHQFEVNLLTPRQNNGIRIIQETINNLNHRINLKAYLQPKQHIKLAIQKLNDKDYLTQMIQKYFISNNHKVIVRQLLPEEEMQVQSEITSKVIIDDSIIENQQNELIKRQNQVQDANVLPILTLNDIQEPTRNVLNLIANQTQNNKKYERYHLKIREGINFYRLVFNFKTVSKQFLSKLSLWIYTTNRGISTNSLNYRELATEIAKYISNFNVLPSVGIQNSLNIVFQFSCLTKNVQNAFALVQQIILTPKYEKDHILNSFKAFSNQTIQGIVESPMSECLDQAGSGINLMASIKNQYQRMKEGLINANQKDIKSLYQISLQFLNCSSIKLIEHSNQVSLQMPVIQKLLKLPQKSMKSIIFEPKFQSLAVTYNYMVNFCAQAYAAPAYLTKDHAHINLLLQILKQDYLHPLIRQKGGAYGSGAQIKNNSTICLSSYMDPHSSKTFQAFDLSINQLLSLDKIDQSKLNQAKIKQFGQIDRVKVPQNQGISEILIGYDLKQFKQFRNVIKTSNFKQIVETGKKYLHKEKSRCIFGKNVPQGFVEQELKKYLL